MSNTILTSSQYQNYRRIDLIVIHCSATRATQRYTVDDCRRDHRARDQPEDTRTPEQKETLQRLLERLKEDYPDARVVGYRDLPGVKKDCPCFDVNGASFME